MKKNQIIIFDTTLRDGEQCPGASMNLREKLEIARQLARLNVDVIEAGFPVISDGDFAVGPDHRQGNQGAGDLRIGPVRARATLTPPAQRSSPRASGDAFMSFWPRRRFTGSLN